MIEDKQNLSKGDKEAVVTLSIVIPNKNDVLRGRGGATNIHDGNVLYRNLVQFKKPQYKQLPRHHKRLLAKSIVLAMKKMTPPGRFLDKRDSGQWYEIALKQAIRKTLQALREKSSNTSKSRFTTETDSSHTRTVNDSDLDQNKKSSVTSNTNDLARPTTVTYSECEPVINGIALGEPKLISHETAPSQGMAKRKIDDQADVNHLSTTDPLVAGISRATIENAMCSLNFMVSFVPYLELSAAQNQSTLSEIEQHDEIPYHRLPMELSSDEEERKLMTDRK